MDLFEYQARELFATHGVPVLPGGVAETPEEAGAIAERLGGRVVVKAQVKTGGRGKAGGVKLADDPDGRRGAAPRTSWAWTSRATSIHRVMVAQASDIAEEYYFSYLLDRANRTFLAMASVEGGMDIEEVAATKPEALAKIPIDATTGVDEAKAAEIVDAAELPGRGRATRSIAIAVQLWEVFVEGGRHAGRGQPAGQGARRHASSRSTARSPSTRTPRFRQPEHAALEDAAAADPLEAAAKEKDLNYVKLDGEVGIIGNGAGLVMSTLDVVAYAGEEFGGVKPANFLDIGGGASAEVMANGLRHHPGRPGREERLRQRLRRDHRLRRGRQRHRARRWSMLGRRGDQAARRPARRQQRRGGPADPRRGRTTRWSTVVDTMDGAARRAAELAAADAAEPTGHQRWRSSSTRTARSSSRA